MSVICPFCEIVADRAPAEVLHRWHVATEGRWHLMEVVAFVPLAPVTMGHVLVVPFTHVEDAAADPEVTAITMQCAARYASDFRVGAFNLITSAGAAATQTVRHLHAHIVPRRSGDGLTLPWSPPVSA